MDSTTAIIVAAGSYLIGAFSFSRAAVKILAPGKDIESLEIPVTGTDKKIAYTFTGGTAAGMILGQKMGALVGGLDILKAIVPVLILRFVYPQVPEYMLIASFMITLGHNFPVYYRFRGGGGYSTIFGGLLVISPLGALVCAIGGMGLGLFVLRDFGLMYVLQLVLIIPWMAIRFGELPYILFGVAVNILFFLPWLRLLPQLINAPKPERKPTLRETMQDYPMGASMLRMFEKMRIKID